MGLSPTDLVVAYKDLKFNEACFRSLKAIDFPVVPALRSPEALSKSCANVGSTARPCRASPPCSFKVAVRLGISHPVADLGKATYAYLDAHSTDRRPFVWTASVEEIVLKVRRGGVALR